MNRPTREEPLGELLAPCAEQVAADLSAWLVELDTPEPLAEAMRYCALGGGKRLRPALVYFSAEAGGGRRRDEPVRRAAAAVEMVHAYSLVHDDLPALDNDTLRRARPTAHVTFGQAMAILAGDALLTRAFAVLAEMPGEAARPLAAELARAAGCAGMIAGQVADMGLCPVPPGPEGLRYVHLRKTAALMRAAARMGAVAARAEPAVLAAVSNCAEALGLAFQLIDDVLDVTAGADQIGKTPGKDARAQKRTHVAEIGLRRARQVGEELTARAAAALQPLGARGKPLRSLVRQLADRTY
jgi:geranylgeranyl pyrophosphate synthase